MKKPKPRKKPGPKALRVKIEGDWQAAIAKMLKKPKSPTTGGHRDNNG
jgi:hypothetical protein